MWGERFCQLSDGHSEHEKERQLSQFTSHIYTHTHTPHNSITVWYCNYISAPKKGLLFRECFIKNLLFFWPHTSIKRAPSSTLRVYSVCACIDPPKIMFPFQKRFQILLFSKSWNTTPKELPRQFIRFSIHHMFHSYYSGTKESESHWLPVLKSHCVTCQKLFELFNKQGYYLSIHCIIHSFSYSLYMEC